MSKFDTASYAFHALRMMRGTVDWFDAEKGVGIIVADSGERIFVRHRDPLRAGQRVVFDVGIGSTGNPIAEHVQIERDVHH